MKNLMFWESASNLPTLVWVGDCFSAWMQTEVSFFFLNLIVRNRCGATVSKIACPSTRFTFLNPNQTRTIITIKDSRFGNLANCSIATSAPFDIPILVETALVDAPVVAICGVLSLTRSACQRMGTFDSLNFSGNPACNQWPPIWRSSWPTMHLFPVACVMCERFKRPEKGCPPCSCSGRGICSTSGTKYTKVGRMTLCV